MYFPLFVDLTEKEILVVGAGRIAARRIRSMSGFAGHITVVAPDIPADTESQITALRRPFAESDLDGKDLVLAATDDVNLNRHICELCRKQGILVNVCTDRTLCDFQFPSVVENGPVVIGINASGREHHLVKETRRRVEELFEEDGIQSRYD